MIHWCLSLDIPCSPTCSAQKTCVQGVCVGIGYLSCTMTWSRPGDGDIVVTTPNNNTISFHNRGPSTSTDQGQLDVDDTVGTGPENVFWQNNGPYPPYGTYYVCFEPYSFSAGASISKPIVVTVQIVRSTSSTLFFSQNFTSYQTNSYECTSNCNTLLGSFTYP